MTRISGKALWHAPFARATCAIIVGLLRLAFTQEELLSEESWVNYYKNTAGKAAEDGVDDDDDGPLGEDDDDEDDDDDEEEEEEE